MRCLPSKLGNGCKIAAHGLLPNVGVEAFGDPLLFFDRKWRRGQACFVENEHRDVRLGLFLLPDGDGGVHKPSDIWFPALYPPECLTGSEPAAVIGRSPLYYRRL